MVVGLIPKNVEKKIEKIFESNDLENVVAWQCSDLRLFAQNGMATSVSHPRFVS